MSSDNQNQQKAEPSTASSRSSGSGTGHLGIAVGAGSTSEYIMNFQPAFLDSSTGEHNMSTDDFEDDKSSTSETFDMNTFEPIIKNVIISTDFGRPLAQEEDLVVFNQGKNAGNYVIGTIKRHHECCVLDPADQMNQLTGGRVTRVKNIFKNNSEKRLVEETCLVYRHFAKSDAVLRFRNKYATDPAKRRMRIADMANVTKDVGIVIDTKVAADILVLPEKTRVLRNVPITQEKTIEFINLFSQANFIFFNGWFGNLREAEEEVVVSTVFNSETYRVILPMGNGTTSFGVEMIRPGVDNGKAFYVGESVKIYLSDLLGKRAKWERTAPYRLVAKKKRNRDAQAACIIEEIRTKSVIVDWITSPSCTERPPEKMDSDLDKIKRIHLQLPPQYVAHDRLEFSSQSIKPEQLITLKEWKAKLKEEFSTHFEKAVDFLSQKSSRKSKSRGNTPMDESSEPIAKNARLDEDAMRNALKEAEAEQTDVAMEENDANLEAEEVEEADEGVKEQESAKKRKIVKKKRGGFYPRKVRKRKETIHQKAPEIGNEDLTELLGQTFIGEILRPYMTCDLQMLDGSIVHNVPSYELQIYELDLDQMDHIPGVIVIKKDCKNPDDEFGIIMKVDAEERSCLVRWFARKGISECALKCEEECTLFEIMRHSVYNRDLIGHYAVSLKSDFGTTDADRMICQVMENLDDGKQRVRYFDGTEDFLWPFEMTTVNLDDVDFDMDDEGPTLITSLSINGTSTSRESFGETFNEFISSIDENNKDRFEVYGKMIKKFVCRSSPSHVSENPKEYIMGFIFRLMTKEIERSYKDRHTESQMRGNLIHVISLILLNVLLDMNSEAIKTVFSAFDFFSNLSAKQADLLEFIERFKENQNNVKMTEGVTLEQAKYYFEVGVEFYDHLMTICKKVVDDNLLKGPHKFKDGKKLAQLICPVIAYTADRYKFDSFKLPDESGASDPNMRYPLHSIQQIINIVLSTKSSTTDFPETMSQKMHPVLPLAECNVQLFNFWKELNQAVEKNLHEDTAAGDKPTTSSASHSASSANSAAALLRQLDPVNPHANCMEKSSFVSHLKFAVSLGELETIVQGTDEDFLHSCMILICELAGHYNDDSVIDGDSEMAKFCFGEEVELFRKFHEATHHRYHNKEWETFVLLLTSVQMLEKFGLVQIPETVDVKDLCEQLHPHNFFPKAMADEKKKGALCAMVELFGRRLFDMLFVISEYLQLHSEETANSLKVLLENRNRTLHPVLLFRQLLQCVKEQLPALREEAKKSMFTSISMTPSVLGGSFEVLDECTDHAFLSKPPSVNIGMSKTLAKEYKLLSDLPSGIHVRAFADRIDLLTLVICGPADTPFDTTPFLIDLWLPSNYPNEPPKASQTILS
ncbi:hypothetical protein WR25_22706 [Diploscapter pachys]|uniref:UBC core domain-containing protein n=1 Tax=Diploscapter pachys TaxID=2018661 RepID=A0A2A2M0S7_9BILA|nr:hypothetical protein WR25_22706 [Diploscapter pachys]